MHRPAHRLLLSALTIFAFCATSPHGFTAGAADTSTSVARLSAEQLKKLNDLFALNGRNTVIGATVATRLGISTVEIKQLGFRDKGTGDGHAYAALPNGEMLFTFQNDKGAYSYRVGANFKIVASVAMIDFVPSAIPNPEAGAKSEMAFWARVASQF
jgi:hypothetical protein